MKLSFSTFLVSAAFPVVAGVGSSKGAFGWASLEVHLPKTLSDLTAATSADGIIYIAGGCDAAKGNLWIPTSATDGYFACDSISSSFYSFNPTTRKFEQLADLPRPRYRHSETIVDNQVWLVGGRTVQDNIIPEIDVYDIGTKSWTTRMLPQQYQLSDQATFYQFPSMIYVFGGYDQNYTALNLLTRIDATSLQNDTLAIESMATLNYARGDVWGTVSTDGQYGYVAGGFTNVNNFCAPLGSVERYDFAQNKWDLLPPLVNSRGETVLAEIDNQLYALGGERQIKGICKLKGKTDPGEMTVGMDEVDHLNAGKNKWEMVAGFPNRKFRFAAAVAPDNIIYTFGGQAPYDSNCMCFRTTDYVAIFGDGVSAAVSFQPVALSFFAMTAMAIWMAF